MRVLIRKYRSFWPVILLLPLIFLPLKYVAVIFFIAVFALYLHLKYPPYRGRLEKLLWLSFLSRVVLVLANDLFSFLPEQPDIWLYSSQAMRIVDNLSRNLPVFYDVPYSQSVKSYALFLSLAYGLFGELPLLASLINCFLGVLTGVLVYKMSRELFEEERIALVAAAFTLFLPSIVVFTSYALRDALVFFLTMGMLYHIVLAGKGKKVLANISLAFFEFLLVSIIRIQNLYLYSAFFLLYLALYLLSARRLLLVRISFVLFIGIGVLVFYFRNQELVHTVLTYPLRAQPLRAVGGSAYLQNMQYNSLFDVVKYLPVRFIYFTFGPFLWQARGSFLLLSALEGLVILAAAFFTFKYFTSKKGGDVSLQLFLLLFCLTGLMANSIVDSNFGTAVRHRMIYIVFFFIFTSAYLKNVRIKWL